MSAVAEALAIAEGLALRARVLALQHAADIDTATTGLSALGAAGAWYEADREATKWQAVADALRARGVES